MASPQVRRLRLLLGSAGILAVVGLGNGVFGYLKAEEYRETLSEATSRLTRLNQESPLPLPEPALAPDPQNQAVRFLEARITFYEYVSLGGKIMLALAGVLLLATLSWGLTREPL